MSDPVRVHMESVAPASAPTTGPFVNRELSWLQFNARVLAQALDPSTPLLERLRFLIIFHTNLDEFFMIRVSGIKQQIAAGVDSLSIDGLTPKQQLARVWQEVTPSVDAAQRCLTGEVLPALAQHGIEIVPLASLPTRERRWADEFYEREVYPILTPLAVGSTHPFPFISNLSLNLALMVRSLDGEERLARVKVPLANVPRLVPVGDRAKLKPPVRLFFVEELIAANLGALFQGMEVGDPYMFRVTRDADLEIREDEADDLMSTLQQELRKRRFGQAVRLEVQRGMPERVESGLRRGLGLAEEDVIEVSGPFAIPRLTELMQLDMPELKYRRFVPRTPAPFAGDEDLFETIRRHDVLVHHPFDGFDTVVDFVLQAARDPKVVAIKQSLYRTSGDSPVIHALEEAVDRGKQVAAVVELKARFDEENNIVWARRLEEAGVHVIYGLPGLKTHAKLCLVVRREKDALVRYAHVGSGNYNPATAAIYTDLGLFTSNPEITADAADLFNRMTGFARPNGYRQLLVAPTHMKQQILDLLAFETREARAGRPSGVIAKCNAITDLEVIGAIEAASHAGVSVELLVRGICSLVPGVAGRTENVRVRSVVGRFLEHERLYWLAHAGTPQVYIGSADWMHRNLERRVEILVPILDPTIARWSREVLLERYLQDRNRTWEMQPDGTYVRLRTGHEDPDVHDQFLADKDGVPHAV